jgi:hypothetical protein
MRVVWCALLGLMAAGAGLHQAKPAAQLRVDDTIEDLLAFAGFGRLLLPWDGRRYDATMPLMGNISLTSLILLVITSSN